jgi:hypothetical protein
MRSYQTVINCIIDAYFDAIKVATTHLQNCKICIHTIPPAVEKEGLWDNPTFPFLGTNEERKMYVEYYVDRLRQKCVEYGYLFIDIYDKYTDKNGYLNKELNDNCHMDKGPYLKEFLDLVGLSSWFA